VTIQGGSPEPVVKTLPKHKKNPDVGEKTTVYTSSILIDQEDALSFGDNEEVRSSFPKYRVRTHERRNQITLMDWGNAIVRSKEADSSGTITALVMELHLEGDFKTTTKKITWLAQPTSAHPLVDATLIDHDYLITKKKLEEEDDLKDFVTPVTEFREDALADANVRELTRGDIVQFERRGYYAFDGVVGGGADERPQTWEFIRIPDGRAAGLASKAGATSAAAAGKVKEKKGNKAAAAPGAAGGVDTYGVTPADTKMYEVGMVVGTDAPDIENATKMYRVESVYKV
jgi:glutamyl-tRNA synthetase